MLGRKRSSLVVLSGEKGARVFHDMLHAPKTNYNPKQKAKEARRELRKQGFHV